MPLGQVIYEYFEREVKPHAPDAWIEETVRNGKDGNVGIVGYEIPFTSYFYKYEHPGKLEKIEEEIKRLENETNSLLKDI